MRKYCFSFYGAIITLIMIISALIGCGGGGSSTGGYSTSPCNSGEVDCLTFCCPSGYRCCFTSGRCCPDGYPYRCDQNGNCYKNYTDAQRYCGNSWESCGARDSQGKISYSLDGRHGTASVPSSCGNR